MLSMLIMFITILAWSMLATNNPMTLSLIILTIAISSSLIYCFTISSWYALILFLIYIGGMMVMFSYFVSLSSNDSMMLKTKMHFLILPYILWKTMFMDSVNPNYNGANLSNFYMSTNIIIFILISMILLFMMIIIIKVVKTEIGPLRSFSLNNY